MSFGELILYTTEDGLTKIQLRAEDGTIWLTQAAIAELFQTTPQNITIHIKSIYSEGELTEEATCKESLQVQNEGTRKITRKLKQYNLDIILAIGYRVQSPRGTAFRQWAITHLSEYLIKGFVMDDERLKEPGGWDYFDELLARIKEIRTSEKRFYQKVKDLYALSTDYRSDSAQVQIFFKTVQNKMIYAVTGQTAAELIVARAYPTQYGKISHENAEKLVHEHYDTFDTRRKQAEQAKAEAEALEDLEHLLSDLEKEQNDE